MQFPVALPGEGVVDVVVQTLVPRTVLATSMNGAELGKHFYLDCVSSSSEIIRWSMLIEICLSDIQQHYYKGVSFSVFCIRSFAHVSLPSFMHAQPPHTYSSRFLEKACVPSVSRGPAYELLVRG